MTRSLGPYTSARLGSILSRRTPIIFRFLLSILSGTLSVANAATPIEGSFLLSNLDGRVVNDRTYRGKWELIYFGFTTCPEICTTVMQRVALALGELGPTAEKLQPLFVTLDPAQDTPRRLAQYLLNFDHRLIGLTGTEKQVEDAARSFHMYVKRSALSNGASTIEHSSFLFLMKPDGTFARLLSADTSGHDLAEELRTQLQ